MKRTIGNSCALLLALLIGAPALAQRIQIELRNGDRITGQLLSETTNTIVLSNGWAPALTIPLAQISRRTADTNTALAGTGGTNQISTNAVQLAKQIASTNTLFTSPILKNWHGDIQLGADLTFSERNRQVFNGRSKISYAKDHFKSIFEYDMTYGRSQDEQTIPGTTLKRTKSVTDANRMNGSVKLEYDLTKKWYVYSLGAAGYDEIRKIDIRYEVGPGVGYRLIQVTNFFVNLEAGFNYQDEEHSDHTSIDTFFFRFAEATAWKITPRLTWDERFEYFSRVEDTGLYRMRFETNLRYAMLQNIFFNISLVDIYDSAPAKDVAQNDLQLRSSVGVKF